MASLQNSTLPPSIQNLLPPSESPTDLIAGTLGADLVGLYISTILYGITCLQIFLYVTSPRTLKDGWFLKTLVVFLLRINLFDPKALDTVHEITVFIGMYHFLVLDFLSPLQLLNDTSHGPGSVSFRVAIIASNVIVLLVQLFYTWRFWVFSMNLSKSLRWTLATLTLIFALATSATGLAVLIEPGADTNPISSSVINTGTPYKVNVSTGIACDAVITFGMMLNLHRSRSTIQSTNSGVTFLMMSIFNTGLLTIIVAIGELICFFAFPPTTLAYAALGLILSRCYVNSFLATLNSREYLREKMSAVISISFANASKSTQQTIDTNPSRLESGMSDINDTTVIPKETHPVKIFYVSEETVHRDNSIYGPS